MKHLLRFLRDVLHGPTDLTAHAMTHLHDDHGYATRKDTHL